MCMTSFACLRSMRNVYLFLSACLIFCALCFDVDARAFDPLSKVPLASYPEQLSQGVEEPRDCHPLLHDFQPISGQWSFKETDLTVNGAEPLRLQRIFLSPHIVQSYHKKDIWDRFYLYAHAGRPGNGWNYLPEQFMQARAEQDRNVYYVTDSTGVTLAFRHHSDTHTYSLDMEPQGMHNGLHGLPSSTYDYRNSALRRDRITGDMIFTTPDGVERFYKFPKTFLSRFKENMKGCLEKTRLRNGMILRYHYTNEEISRIDSLDPTETLTYATLSFSQEKRPDPFSCTEAVKVLCTTTCTASTGLCAKWQEEILSGRIKLKQRKDSWKGWLPSVRLLRSISSPQNGDASFAYETRFMCTTLVTKEGKLKAEYAPFGPEKDRHYRIKTLFRQDEGGTYQPLYHFDYTLPEIGRSGGSTRIQLIDGSSIVYQINADLLINRILWNDPSGKVVKEERFTWNAKQWCVRKELYAPQVLVRTHFYVYDAKGNPTHEEIRGDLTGDGSMATTRIKRTFSQDALALLLSEERDNGRIDRYTYLPGTDLLESHLILDHNRMCKRLFYIYNAHHQLIEKCIDNGSSTHKDCLDNVTTRYVTRFTLREEAPFLHLPKQKEEYVLEHGNLRRTSHTCFTYDAYGNIATEERYDENGQLFETVLKEYNTRGDVISKTNALGETSTYTYDAYGRKTEEVPYSADRKMQWLWDSQGRCTAYVVTGNDGLETRYRYSYDRYDEPIEEIGPLGECTKRQYTPLFGHLVREQKPATCSLNDRCLPVVEEYAYDGMGRRILHKNSNGTLLHTQYTAYGKPHTIAYADGTQESFRYTVDGHLKQYTDREGLQVHYTWDIWDHLIEKKYMSKQGTWLAQESWEYNPFHLLRTTDCEGHITEYVYDAQGRMVEEKLTPRCTRRKYDARGDVEEIIYVHEDKNLYVQIKRDALGREIEKHFKDDKNALLKWEGTSYDAAGNIAAREWCHEGQRVKECFTYDTLDRLIRHEDCNGAVTRTRYDKSPYRKALVETKQTTSPEGEITRTWYDHAGRQWIVAQWDRHRRKLLCQEHEYDPLGNLLNQRESFYDEEGKPTLHMLSHSYTQDNLVASSTRAAGTDHARTTTYTYSPEGRLTCRQNPSGSLVYYAYDDLGYLRSVQASDHTVDQQLRVNRLGELLEATDQTTGLSIQRTVDRFGNILSETFPLGKQMHRRYDARGRLEEIEMPDLSRAHYTYDSLFLRAVEILSPQGESIAKHCYTEYDLDGSLRQELLPSGLGVCTYRKDAKGCLLEMKTPHQTIVRSYDTQNRLGQQSAEYPLEKSTCCYTYDGLSQLLSEEDEATANTYQYDMQGCHLKKNAQVCTNNPLCENLSCGKMQFAYDLDGNRTEKIDPQTGSRWTYQYNALNQCTQALSDTCRIHFAYDALGRKSRRMIEQRANTSLAWQEVDRLYFLYQDHDDVGAYRETGDFVDYRVLGISQDALPRTVYIELEGKGYIPQLDAQGSITHLLDPATASMTSIQRYTAFGEALPMHTQEEGPASPWRYFSKRMDPDLGLIDFGKRWYDPEQARWTTLDPAGFVNGTNLYRFVKNNPLLYSDPDGQFAFVIPVVSFGWSGVAWFTTEVVLAALGTAAVSYGAYELCQYIGHKIDDYREARWEEKGTRVCLEKYYDHDPVDDEELAKDPKWKDESHEEEKKRGRKKFVNQETGEIIEFDKGKPDETGHKQCDHYHRKNPKSVNRHDEYLDNKGNPCSDTKASYHLYNPNKEKWSY